VNGPAAGGHGLLDGPRPVIAAGVLAALAVLVVWGSLGPVPVMHDEWAYWLQADQYAHLHWKMASPALPQFFEQLYVLVTPVFAAKYPPGYAMAIAPGFALGLPALVPLALTGATGALVFALARRVAGAPAGALTWVLWLGTFGNLRFRAAYFSEVVTSFCWLVAWWALVEWRATQRTKWMLVLAVATGWGAITRPATMLVFAIPVAVVVLRDAAASKRWRDVALGVVAGSLVLAVLPLWNAETTGDWRTTPLALYTRQYLPFDVPGYTVNDTPPERALPPEMERVRSFLRDIKHDQATAPVWLTAFNRAALLLRDSFGGWRLPFALAFLFGLGALGAEGRFALGTSALLIAAYLSQAHTPDWVVYYLETIPVIAFTAAVGTVRALARVRARLPAPPRWLVPLAAAGFTALLASDVAGARAILARIAAEPRLFRAAVAALPKKPNIVFVRYDPRRNMHIALVQNRGMLPDAESWIVHDRGADDLRLYEASHGRAAYVFDEATGAFHEARP
jgi:4-amino-4-deoxy-L-arabinose transferase-like glycosyltransferase